MQEHPLIEMYITIEDERQNALIEQQLSSVNLDELVSQTLRMVGIDRQVMLTLLITDDAGIHEMNQQYRQQDKATDVLSFPLLDAPIARAPADQLWAPLDEQESKEKKRTPAFVNPPGAITNLGDIVISWPTIERQAASAGHSAVYEFLYLLAHGVLHLIGYDDQTEAGYQAMVRIQEAVLQTLARRA